MTGTVNIMLDEIMESINKVSMLIDEELSK
jgi:hypothetical protein